ncbi:lipase secretion chaperone [Rhodoferax sp. PAMC 29310]|uniref:lipase secretion chaperone n=1 Tax=Rhodoferax sp. PAMC 29310 TaxID=2822760 RepID=UPI001B32733F|nr:lipase secretion chaperone [Rhodoferax sp. PAMC 29310]
MNPVRFGLLFLALLGLIAIGWAGWPETTLVAHSVAAKVPAITPSPFVRSMQDTLPDGDLRAWAPKGSTDSVDPGTYGELKRLFDYYLSAIGEQNLDAIVLQIRSELDRRLTAGQALQAKRLLASYLDYKRELAVLEGQVLTAGGGVAAVRRRLNGMQDLRAQFFNAVEDRGMFGLEDAADMGTIARLEVSQNATLTSAQKKAQLAALDESLPLVLKEQRDATQVVTRAQQAVVELRAQGGSEDDVYRMRSKTFDSQAAARLAEVDREETAWKGRIDRYLSARAQLLKSHEKASPSEIQQGLQQLQQARFTGDEQRRLAAFEP